MFRKKQKFISLKEAAKLTGYASDYIGSLIRKGKLTGKKVYSGISWMINEGDIKKYQEKIEAQKLKSTKNWKVLKFVSDFFPPIKIPVRVKETTKKIVGIQDYNTKRAKIFAFSWRGISIVLVLLSFIGIGPSKIWQKLVAAFTGEEKTINLYSTTCNGEWQNPQNSQGQPEVGELGDLNSFSESNSAVYKGGSLSLICQNFEKDSEEIKTEDLENFKIQSAKIKFSFAIGEKKPDLEIPQSLPEESAPVTPGESAPLIPEESTPSSSEQPAPADEEALPIEQPQNIETSPEVVPPPESVPPPQSVLPSESAPKVENTTPSADLFKKIKNLFSVLTAEAQGGNIPTEETISPIEEATPTTEGILAPTEDINTPTQEVITPNLDTKIIIWYSLDNETWWQLANISEQPVSNFLSGGHFVYDAPFLKSFEDVKNIKIKIEGVIGGETTIVAYLDSVWIEVVYEPEKKNEPKMDDSETELKEIKKIQISDNSLIIPDLQNDFSSNDEPSFIVSEPEIKTEDIISAGKGRLISGVETIQENYRISGELISNEEYFLASIESNSPELIPDLLMFSKKKNQKDSISVQIFRSDGLEAGILPEIQPILKDGKESFEIKFTKEKIREFKPGLYKLKVKLETADSIFFLEQDFSWGVLAINANKSIYLPGEKAYVQMGVLRDDGTTICDAKLKLEIKNPNYEINTFLTEDGTIQYSDECGPKSVTYKPDYFSYFDVGEAGNYEIKLTNLDNGYEVLDSFKVEETVPFDIERIGPTRIYPSAKYEMKMVIKTHQDFSGEITEKVPASFLISEQEGMRQEINGEEKSLIWKADWKDGEIYELNYQFDAPDISPYIFLLGPLIISNKQQETSFQEIRQWQIASDRASWTEATCYMPSNTYACYDDVVFGGCTGAKCLQSAYSDCSKACTTRANAGGSPANCVLTYSSPCSCYSSTLCNGETGTCTITTNTCFYTCYANWEDCNQVTSDGCECSLLTNTCVGTTCTPIPSGITVSGTVYADEASTIWQHCDSSTANISLAVNGVVVQTTHCHTPPDGTYSFTSVTVAAGQEVAVFMNATHKGIAATVAKDASTTPITLNPIEGRVWVKEEVSAPSNITNTLLDKSDKLVTGCTNVPYTVTGTALTVDDTYKIVIETGKTFVPGGNVTTPAMEIMASSATYTAGSFTLTLNSTGSGATCTAAAGTMMPLCIVAGGIFTASTDTVNYTGTAATTLAVATYYNMGVGTTADSNAVTYTLGGDTTVTSVLTVGNADSGGYVDLLAGSSYTLTLSGSGIPFVLPSWGDFSAGSSTVKFTGTAATTLPNLIGLTYYNLGVGTTADGTAVTYTLGMSAWVQNVLTVGNASSTATDTLAGSSRTLGFYGSGTPFNITAWGNFSAGTSIVRYGYSGASTTYVTGTTYYDLYTGISDSTATYTAAGDITVTDVLTIRSSSGINTFDASNKTITLSGSGTPFVIAETEVFTASTSTIKYTGNGDTNITAATYNNLELSPTITDNRIYTGAGAITVGGTLNINPNATAKYFIFYLGGTTSVTGAITIQRTGTASSYLDTTLVGHYSLTASSISIQTASILLAYGSTITLTASSGQPLSVSGSGYFNYGTSNVVFTGDGNITIGDIGLGVEYYDLTFSPTITASRIYYSSGSIEIGHNLDINPNASSVYSLTFNLGGYFYTQSGTITIQRTNLATSVLDTTISSNTLLVSVINIQTGGTLTANGSIIWIKGTSGTPFTVNGTFNYGTSIVFFDGNGDITIAATTYFVLQFQPALGLSTNRTYTGGGAITVNNNMEIYPTGSGTESLTFNLGGTTSVTGSLTIKRAGSVTSILNTTISNHSLTVGSLSIWIGGTLTGNASALDSNGDVTIASGGTLTSTSGNFNVGGSWSNSATGVFTHSSGTVIFDATTTGKTISDGGDPFYNISFTGTNGGWTYTDSSATASCDGGSCPKQTTVSATSGTVTYINAKTGTVSVTAGTLTVDWYLGIHVVDKLSPSTDIDTGNNDITISENSASPGPYSTVWRYNGGTFGEDGTGWESPATQKNTGTLSTGKNPQPFKVGAIRIREYSMTNSSQCPGSGCTIYKYNLQIAEQANYGEYDYYLDY
jgi:hypothetical protein